MNIVNAIGDLKEGDLSKLDAVYIHFRPTFMSWMNTSHKKDMDLAVEIYKYAIASFYEALFEETSVLEKESEVRLYLLSVAKNKILSDSKTRTNLSYQAELEEEALEDQLDKKQRLDKLKKLVSIQGYPCKDLLRFYYFNSYSKERIAQNLEYKNANAVDELKEKCVRRINKLLRVANEEI